LTAASEPEPVRSGWGTTGQAWAGGGPRIRGADCRSWLTADGAPGRRCACASRRTASHTAADQRFSLREAADLTDKSVDKLAAPGEAWEAAGAGADEADPTGTIYPRRR
jgi:hypothetical protein